MPPQRGLAAVLYNPSVVYDPVTRKRHTEHLSTPCSPAYVLWLWTMAVETGYRGPYPWSKLVQWWYDEVPIEINKLNSRLDPVMAAPLIMVNQKSRQARLFSSPGRLVHRPYGQAYLPRASPPAKSGGPSCPCCPWHCMIWDSTSWSKLNTMIAWCWPRVPTAKPVQSNSLRQQSGGP